MSPANTVLEPVFSEYIPRDLAPGTLYISLDYATSSHLCACGCGNRVITPLSPADWILTFDGTVTLDPSIGNGQMPCRSHYFIHRNQVVWARTMSQKRIAANLTRDEQERETHYNKPGNHGFWQRLRRRLLP